jgi:integrase
MSGSKRERPKGSGRWELRVYVGNDPLRPTKPVYRSSVFHNSDKSASARARASEADKALARFVTKNERLPIHQNSSASFADLLEVLYRLKAPHWSVLVQKNRRGLIDNHIVPALGAIPIKKLTTTDLDLFYAALRTETPDHRALSKDLVKKIHGLCYNALERAVIYEWLDRNVAARTEPIKATETHIDLPPLDDVKRFMQRCYEWDPPLGYYLFAKIAIGCRRGELCGLMLHDVDFDEGAIILRRAVVDEGKSVLRIKDLKGHRIRRFALDNHTLSVLAAQRDLMAARAVAGGTRLRGDAFFWSHELDGAVPWRPPYVTLSVTRLREPDPVDPENPDDPNRWTGIKLRVHDLRHLNGTHLVDAGIPIPAVAFRLGHAKNSTTSDFYAHPVQDSDRFAARAIEERLALASPLVGPYS